MQTTQKYCWSDTRLIYEEVQRTGDLQYVAGSVVDFAYALSSGCSFVESSRREWILRPHNWIALHFSYGQHQKRLHVSLDIWPCALDALPGPPVKQGRYASWSRLTIKSITDLLPVMQHSRKHETRIRDANQKRMRQRQRRQCLNLFKARR